VRDERHGVVVSGQRPASARKHGRNCRAQRPRVQADRHRLRLLDLHPQRHDHVLAVLQGQTAGGPSGRDLFDLRNVAIETGFLLASSFTCGLATIAADARSAKWFQIAMAVTCVFGLGFLTIEAREFASLVASGAGPTRSAFLSAFFTLVGCHGLHVSAGILWLLTMMAQVFAKGFRPDIQRRVLCFALFWHALDIIWIAVFTVVYLLGSAK
jgi:cytochrome o ubiquinol oxidase subunit 3